MADATRLAALPADHVWLRFQGRSKDGTPQKFQVRRLQTEHRAACLDLMMESFLQDEPLCQALDLRSDPVSVATVRRDWESILDQGVSVACFVEENGSPATLVGCNVLLVKRRTDDDEVYSTEGKAWLKLLATLQAAESQVDVFERFGVHGYLSSTGLTVRPEYRGQNIGARMIEARKHICEALGLCVSAAVFTARTSQVLAAKCGYEVLATLRYEDMASRGVHLDHPVLQLNPTAELRAVHFQF